MNNLVLSSSPHIKSEQSINSIMRDVLLALLPSIFVGIWVFGLRALSVTLVSVLSCVIFESLWNKINKKENTINDLSACVTGVLLALTLPVSVPLWIPIIGAFFAIIICKQLYGGIGQNFINPALAARAFLLASWPVLLTAYTKPFAKFPIFASPENLDAITNATPLALAKINGQATDFLKLMLGNVEGSIGETSAIAILIGAIYLALRKVIRLEGPIIYILSAGLFGYLFGYEKGFDGEFIFHMISGGLLFGAFFMFTDYVTTPTTVKGTIIAAVLAGFITALIRVKGGYPEGVTYAILLVNVVTPLIDKYIFPKKYGRSLKNG